VKIAVTAQGSDLESAVDSRFGRCAYFVIVDSENAECVQEAIANNPGTSGAGVGAVQLLVGQGIEAVITGNLGPKAARAIETAQVAAYKFDAGTVKEAVAAFQQGKLMPFGK
jgi:predicted Fe-Mo cluster-binding NifX family protein